MLMDIQLRFTTFRTSPSFISANKRKSSSSYNFSAAKPFCSAGKSPEPPENGDDNEARGDKFSTDWDRAWSIYKKQGKKKSKLSQFSPNKYVTWNPRRSEYPLSEEVDPIKRAERSNLMLWTGPGFTLVGAIVIVSFLLLYTILAPVK